MTFVSKTAASHFIRINPIFGAPGLMQKEIDSEEGESDVHLNLAVFPIKLSGFLLETAGSQSIPRKMWVSP